jgi:hypothetical protein
LRKADHTEQLDLKTVAFESYWKPAVDLKTVGGSVVGERWFGDRSFGVIEVRGSKVIAARKYSL